MNEPAEKKSHDPLLNRYVLFVSDEESETPSYLLMGYPLLLSECEGRILRVLLQARPNSVTAYRLAEEFGTTEGQISVQIHRINTKAKTISGRKLIIGISHHGFCFNPTV